jgi:hypothetical protein
MAFSPASNDLLGQAIADNSTSQKAALGQIVTCKDPTYGVGEFIYLKGVASTAVGEWVTYNSDDWSSALLAADAIGPVALAMSACVAGEYGWYQISGKGVGLVATGFADDANCYATATAGTVDDAVVCHRYSFSRTG